MKLFIVSDLHGSAEYCRQTIEAFKRENADKMILLGDVLYHGPRNPLPENYFPLDVVGQLEEIKDKILCARGNCDAEIDGELLPFAVVCSGAVYTDGLEIYFAHGHRRFDIPAGAYLLTGHTHVRLNAVENGYCHLNPGSVSLPKDDFRGYILYENGKFEFKTLDGEVVDVRDSKCEPCAEPAEIAEECPQVEEKPVIKRPQTVRRKIIIRRK